MSPRIFLLCVFFLTALCPRAQLVERSVLPSDTDATITGHNAAHYAYLDTNAEPIAKLMVFLPGTNGTPWDYRMFLKTAAGLGYHSIGLSYENLESINIQICPGTQDPTCHGRARREIWLGDDVHDSIQVNVENSIVNRLEKLLVHLDLNHPTENWGQYLSTDNTVNWQSVLISGHSQGAGHAAYGSKIFPMNRVVMFSWIDWMWPGINPVWVSQSGLTPDSAYFGFIHTGDSSIFNGIPTTWTNFGMDPFGSITLVDDLPPPYTGSHSLITSAPIDLAPTEGNFHNVTCVDWVTSITQNGDTLYKPVWEYLLGFGDSSLNLQEQKATKMFFNIYPNPANRVINIRIDEGEWPEEIRLVNGYGEVLFKGFFQTQLDVGSLKPGVYFLQFLTEESLVSRRFMKH